MCDVVIMDAMTLKSKLGHCKTHAHKFVGQILKSKKLNISFQSDLLKSLMMYSPKSQIKNIASFSKRLMPPYNTPCLTILTKNHEIVTVSWKQCVNKLYGSYNPERKKKERILQAFREEIAYSPKMMQAKSLFHLSKCAGCGKLERLHIDHDVRPFAQILDDFLQKKGLRLQSVKINYESKPYTLGSQALSRDWVQFHDHHATLIGLCKTCNSAKGSGGYKHRR